MLRCAVHMPPYRLTLTELEARLATADKLAVLLRDRVMAEEEANRDLREQVRILTERNRQLEQVASASRGDRDE